MEAIAVEQTAQPTILCVDDETNILSALKRLFRPDHYKVLLADSAAKGLEILHQNNVDLVISDMRMPVMDGAKFLTEVARAWPHVIRILLTGYSDLESTIKAVNEGHIYRYIGKPWEDNDLRISVRRALEQKRLEQEKRELEALTRKQNEQLKSLNSTLEQKVKQRTEEIHQANLFLESAYGELKQSYKNMVSVFAQLIELGQGLSKEQGTRVANLARAIGGELGVDDAGLEDIYTAGLLHNIGKVGLRDELLLTPVYALTHEQRKELREHAIIGQGILMSLDPLEGVAKLIRSFTENYDGSGYPDRLAENDIPLGARILAVASSYDCLRSGTLLSKRLDKSEACLYIKQHKASLYDPEVVQAFEKVIGEDPDRTEYASELKLASDKLEQGMILTRDLRVKETVLLLRKATVLSQGLIDKIGKFEKDHGAKLEIYVRAPKTAVPATA